MLGCGLGEGRDFFIRLSINESSPPRIKPGTQETLEEPLLPGGQW